MKIAIIDIIGIPYDGTTVDKQGLGGSESAVSLNARELTKLGFAVTVFNNCNTDHASPGIYNGVTYCALADLANEHKFDIVISSRTVIPFTDPIDYPKLNDNRAWPFRGMNLYDRILKHAKMRVLWMHDTFCLGDNLIEELAVNNHITDIFTLSDWHTTYIANCNHGRRRNFEVLKDKLFITRNGATQYRSEVDISAKDPNLFVYNASVTKGMIPLVEHIWPKIKARLPAAKLKIIGGYYRFSTNSEPDEQEKKWRIMANDPANAALDIEFTGVITQRAIADILTTASFMTYPAAFPETFGISTLESLLYNTPVITCRFGALEEIALADACYLIDYAIEPNVLFNDINTAAQIDLFVETTVAAYNNKYLHQQKQYYCNIVKDLVSWETVALQWKQHFYSCTGAYLPVDQYRTVSKLNHRVHKVWNRRYHNVVELGNYKSGNEQPIMVVSPFYNCSAYVAECILSVASQDYDNYKHILIDDCSTDDSLAVVNQTIQSLPVNLRSKFIVVANTVNVGAVRNQIENIRALASDDSIVMLLDGDDTLVNDNTIFSYYNTVYDGSTEFTYGSCWSVVDNIPLISQPYPDAVKQAGSYRTHHFNWILPYTHLRTFKKSLINSINDIAFKDANGDWYMAGGDGATFYALIEAADPTKVKCLQDIVYNYNDVNPINDYKVNGELQNRNAKQIVTKSSNMSLAKKKILIAIPTARNIEPTTFKSIYDLEVPDGYVTDFQFFFGYNVDQVRNLIADWTVNNYDYLFSVDSDISFPANTLTKLLAHDRDVVSGLYIQRKPGEHILEVYEHNAHGGVSNIPYEKIKDRGLVEIASCGFGCVLVKAEVMRTVGYPQFQYHSAINHANTISEDVDFCCKALAKKFRIWADTSIQCAHTGQSTFQVNNSIPALTSTLVNSVNATRDRLRNLGNQRLLPHDHVMKLTELKNNGFSPKVVYDIGACVLHWTNEARRVWPDAEYVAFEAMDSSEFLFAEQGMQYQMGVLSDRDGIEVDFYQNDYHPGGNSYYKENEEINPQAPDYFNDTHRRTLITAKLDTVVAQRRFPKPDLIKMDVQGAELDVLKGAISTLKTAKHVILELQVVEYNKGAPLCNTVIDYMYQQGFDCMGIFSNNGPDGDYHFVQR